MNNNNIYLVHIYCLLFFTKPWVNYCIYCNMQNKNMDIGLLKKIIYLRQIRKALKNGNYGK